MILQIIILASIVLVAIGVMKRKKLLGSNTQAISISRSKMLRHTEFYQFETLSVKKPLHPHTAHKAIKEYMEDAGANTYTNIGPVSGAFWSLVDPEMSGTDTIEADYKTFEGSVSGSVKLDEPIWINIALVIGFLLIFAAGFGLLVVIPVGIYKWYLDKFGRGDIHALYTGTYQRPVNGASDSKEWEMSIDIMVSYASAKPVGGELVKPIYKSIVDGLRDVFSNSNVKPARSLPLLYSEKDSDFNNRFPVEI